MNTNGTIRRVSDEEEFRDIIENDILYYFISDSPIKLFTVTEYSMLYETIMS